MSLILRYLKRLFPCYCEKTFHTYLGTLVQSRAIFHISGCCLPCAENRQRHCLTCQVTPLHGRVQTLPRPQEMNGLQACDYSARHTFTRFVNERAAPMTAPHFITELFPQRWGGDAFFLKDVQNLGSRPWGHSSHLWDSKSKGVFTFSRW